MNETHTYSIPQTKAEREALRRQIKLFIDSQSFTLPLSLTELTMLSARFIESISGDIAIMGWIMVEMNNCAWRDTVASIPTQRRILLLPQCLKNSNNCRAEIDELGLLCHRCLNCSIPDLQDAADKFGTMSIVAEGFTSAVELIRNGVVDAVIGVGCLDSLEKAFPLLINNAVPGVAISLNNSGCKDTTVDYDYVLELIGMQSTEQTELLNYGHIKDKSQRLFEKDYLSSILTPPTEQTSTVALDWLAGDGKRWRPYLLIATYMALHGHTDIHKCIEMAAVAVECFHKASLAHDDIQDNDSTRYGKLTINAAYGNAVGINVGDLLLGEGYRLLVQTNKPELLALAVDAHIALCKGQGMELEWSASPKPLDMDFVLSIFCNKTVPAFDVALVMGAICANSNQLIINILHDYSRALGITYQLIDDADDFASNEPLALRPSAVLAALCEQNTDEQFIDELLKTDNLKLFLNKQENKPLLDKAIERVKQMAEEYHQEAIDALTNITNMELKRLLFRVTEQILK